jgi:hypothetical protein
MADEIKISFSPPNDVIDGPTAAGDAQIAEQFAKVEKREALFDQYEKIDRAKKFQKEIRLFSGPKGLEKVIATAQSALNRFEKGVRVVLYGKPEKLDEKKGVSINPLDYGIRPIIDLLVQIDYCNLINYGLNNIQTGIKFDPDKDPRDINGSTWRQVQIWKVQKLAYDIQTEIDGFDDVATRTPEEKRKFIFDKIKIITKKFNDLKNTISPELNEISNLTGIPTSSTSITEIFPQLKSILPSIEDKLQYLNKYSDYRQIPISDFQKLVNIVDKVRLSCIVIQSLSTPAEALSLLPNKIKNELQTSISKVEKLIKPEKAIPFLRNLIETLNKVNQVLKEIISVINFARTITTVLLLLIKIFKKIIIFFKINPGPNLYTWLGLTTIISSGERKVEEGTTKFEDRLTQINYLFQTLFSICSNISIEIQEIIGRLRILIVNLEQCTSVDRSIVDSLRTSVDNVERSINTINKFVKDKENHASTSSRRSAGEYTINIITEEVVEEAFTLRRRYGVAVNPSGLVELSSSPTFASLDSIIIAEVKQLLSSKGLIKTFPSDFTISEEELIEDAKSFLGNEDDINMDLDYENTEIPIDAPENENEDDGIGLNAFLNKLPGGKKLRKKVRESRYKHNQDLITSLKKEDPSGKFTQERVQRLESENASIKIEKLKEERKKLQVLAIASSANPYVLGVTIKKISDINKEIDRLQKLIK